MFNLIKITNCERELLWYEVFPSMAFKAIKLGKKRKIFFITQYLVLYRDNITENHCVIEWISESSLIERFK